MRKSLPVILLVFCFVVTLLNPYGKAEAAVSYRELAEHWAPDFYQDIAKDYSYEADFLTNFNYDGDWNRTNNWNNLFNYPLKAYVYYSVVETNSHYFIGYYTFHPRDDGPIAADRHGNDMESCLLVIRKDGTTYGKFQLMETMAHYILYQYTNDGNIKTGKADIDGKVLFNGHRPKVYIQPNGLSPNGGHGVHAYQGGNAQGNDGIVYYYGGAASTPKNVGGNWTQRWSYDLKDFNEIFSRRENICASGCTFEKFGNAPWGWDNYLPDGDTTTGDILADPAHMVDTHLNGLGTFSHNYIKNPYATHIVTIQNVTSMRDADVTTKSDLFVKVKAGGESVAGRNLWMYWDSAVGTKRSVTWGANAAADGNQYSSSYNKRYLVKPAGSAIKIEVMDYDNTTDESMGYKSVSLQPGTSKTFTDVLTNNGDAKFSAVVQAVQ